jgi:hypothetical protein
MHLEKRTTLRHSYTNVHLYQVIRRNWAPFSEDVLDIPESFALFENEKRRRRRAESEAILDVRL